MPNNRVVDRPIILGLVGDSAAGKSTLAKGIVSILGPERVALLQSDDYHRYSRSERRRFGVTALDPAANYLDILEQHVCLLRQGKPVLKPVYDHMRGTLERPVLLEPKPFIIVEGLLGYHTRALRDCFDVKVFVDPDEALRVKWKMARDCAERGYGEDEVKLSLERRAEDSQAHIHPQRTFADIVVRFAAPETQPDECGARLNARHLLRPTLPHPDLGPVLDAGGKSGFRLALARDTDGKPVDVLDIAGDIESRRAKAVEDLLWSLIPEANHLRAPLGQFIDHAGQPAQSHSLALSQLLLTYHLVKAALGHFAR
ncbi:putative Phosphoribulokinase [Magnetospirillum sp. LM-5]|uniref:phosphoribulokinase n=1 Tax=Magnetospirillum sp. LM-5 TaxID=2681466 RepID=UPI001382726B|nr:phosphoribulokinase [Magnetospirillum sp. LM-5]CAA7617652.1 putative Phosphoribulokinase [Magnetospirillum sp. LM-5]